MSNRGEFIFEQRDIDTKAIRQYLKILANKRYHAFVQYFKQLY